MSILLKKKKTNNNNKSLNFYLILIECNLKIKWIKI